MAYGVKPAGIWVSGSSTWAKPRSTCSTTTSIQENLVGVDYLRADGGRDQPRRAGAWPTVTEAPHAGEHGYKHHRRHHALAQPAGPASSTGRHCRSAGTTREMFCLMEGRHVHPSTLYPGGVGTVATQPVVHRLHHPADAVRRVHEEGRADARRPVRLLLRGAAGYEEGRPRRVAARLLGQRSTTRRYCDFTYRKMNEWGKAMFVTPGIVVDGEAGHPMSLVDINLGIRILLGSSYYDDWDGQGDVRQTKTRSATRSTGATRGTSTPSRGPQKRDFGRQVQLGHVPPLVRTARTTWRWTPAAGPSPGCGPPRSAGLVDIGGYVKARPGHSVQDLFTQDDADARGPVSFEWKIPKWSNTLERDRARSVFSGVCRRVRPVFRRDGRW